MCTKHLKPKKLTNFVHKTHYTKLEYKGLFCLVTKFSLCIQINI